MQSFTRLTYDATFAGFLTCVFEVYAQKLKSTRVDIKKHTAYVPDMLSNAQDIRTDDTKAARVLTKLEHVLGKDGVNSLIRAFLSEDDSIENTLLGAIAHALAKEKQKAGAGKWALTDYTHADVMQLAKWLKMVGREQHRMLAFVRFELMAFEGLKNKLYFARIEPDFNVLPLIKNHFKRRYADQNWAIYDVRRGYGIFYQVTTQRVEMVFDIEADVLNNPKHHFSDEEKVYQTLWQGYFKHINITERKNDKLHVQYLPKRYWQYLTEKRTTAVPAKK